MRLDLTKLETATWGDLTAIQPDETMTLVEKAIPFKLDQAQKEFVERGAVQIRGLIPHDVLDAYTEARSRLPDNPNAKDNFRRGWSDPIPFMRCQELRNVALWPMLMYRLFSLIGDAMGLNLALTGFVSTERHWHQDSYLNPDFLWSYYCAVWIALDDIHEDSGPFEFVPGSHKWPVLRQGLLFNYLTDEQQRSPDWPSFTQGHIAKLCDAEIERRGAKKERFLAKKGDVLIWHSGLMHRGTVPKDPSLLRKSLICHYSSLIKRYDMKRMRRDDETGQIFFDLP